MKKLLIALTLWSLTLGTAVSQTGSFAGNDDWQPTMTQGQRDYIEGKHQDDYDTKRITILGENNRSTTIIVNEESNDKRTIWLRDW